MIFHPSPLPSPLAPCLPSPQPGAIGILNGEFLTDPEELKKKQEEVANQSKLRYGEGEAK